MLGFRFGMLPRVVDKQPAISHTHVPKPKTYNTKPSWMVHQAWPYPIRIQTKHLVQYGMAVEIVRLIDDPRLLLGIAECTEDGARGQSGVARGRERWRCAWPLGYEIPEERRRAVRQLLKLGGFSATGRNRPSHELLLNDLKERGEFHHINNIVDVNNVVSLEALLPISIFDIDKLGGQCRVRVGREGEGYVFNQSGQWLDVKRCIVCCRLGSGAVPGAEFSNRRRRPRATR